MKKKPAKMTRVRHEPDEELVRDYARHLYEQSGRIPVRDLDNWLEAEACLEACIPRHRSPMRLPRHLTGPEPVEAGPPASEAHPSAN